MIVETLDLTQFKTGLELENYFNKIVMLAKTYQMNHVAANMLLDEIYGHGLKSGKFTKEENVSYLRRRNYNRDKTPRTHLEFALNLSRGQVQEHKVFLYFVDWLKKVNPNKEIRWEFNGSDYEGYIMLIAVKNRPSKKTCVYEPDYKLYLGNEIYLVEAKSLGTPLTFKILNLQKYLDAKCYLIFKYLNKYYSSGLSGIRQILSMEREPNWGQDTIIMSQNNIDKFLENKLFAEFKNAK